MEQTTNLTFNMLPMSIGVLPSSYVDSMSYYETLLWLINYLENTVIPTVNNNSDVTTELQAKYVELKSYVEHYFDNLDVQEEINNKLDEMATSGELEEIISVYLNTKAMFCFDTVADMKAAENLINGSYARTMGYYSYNDGGGSLYKITNEENNEEYQEELENGYYATLIINDTNVKLEMFGGLGNNEYVNDNAFIKAVQTGHDIDLISGKTYVFSGDILNLANIGHRLIINGNNAKVKKLSFKYNINSSNQIVVTSSISSFNVLFKDITFLHNTNPIIITAGQVEVNRCNFSNCAYCFGFPEVYMDYFHASDCFCYNTPTFISPFGYNGNVLTKGMYGDWITFDRCSFDPSQLVYETSAGHSSTLYINTCLHGTYKVNTTSHVTRSYLTFNNCHMEVINDQLPFIQFVGDYIPSDRAITLNNSWLYSQALPDEINFITMNRCTINYGNRHNYKKFYTEKGSFERTNIYGYIWYDEEAFKYNKYPTPVSAGEYSSVIMATNTDNLQTYPESHVVKYTAATSLEANRLYYNGESDTIRWTDEITTTANKCPVYIAPGLKAGCKNNYLHIFKVMDNVTYRCVIPVTNIIRPEDTKNSIKTALYIPDEPEGVFGSPWEVYTGTIEYEVS